MAGTECFPKLRKAVAEGRTILWADESGFYLLPALLRTWAPTGWTLVIRRKLSHEQLSAIGMKGELYVDAQDHAYKGTDVIRFLKRLLAEIPGKLLLIWDGAPINRSRAVKKWLIGGARLRIQLERLPGYAPELNLDAGVWRYLKRVELRNVICADLEELFSEFRAETRRLLGKPQVLRAYVREIGYV